MFEGKTCIVTGGAGGIGAAAARRFASLGAKVALVDLDPARAEAAAAEINAEGYGVKGYGVDVSDAAACQLLARQITAELGEVAVLVNNAGILLRETFDQEDLAQKARQTFEVNVFGMLNMTLACREGLIATKGAVVNTASIGAFVVANTGLSYGPSKAAVKLFTQSLAQEFAPHGVRVNAVAPGPVATPMTVSTRANAEASERLLNRTLLKRFADPSEIAKPIAFLASDQASFITGATLPVDGGYLAM